MQLEKDGETTLESKITHTNYSNPPPDWKVIEDEFVWFICGNTTHLKPDMVGFPFAHIGQNFFIIEKNNYLTKKKKKTNKQEMDVWIWYFVEKEYKI